MKRKLLAVICIFLMAMSACAAAESVEVCSTGNEDHEKGFAAFIAGDYTEAVDYWLRAAQAGDDCVLFDLGWVLWFDKDTLPDQEQYAYWAKKAEEAGEYGFDEDDVYICFELGLIAQEGLHGQMQNDEEAVYWYRKAALGENVIAMQLLAEMYHDRESVLYDAEEAAHWYQQAAQAGDVKSMYALGEMYRSGEGLPQDEQQAVYWIMTAAELDYEKAYSYYAEEYYPPMFSHLRRAAEAGHADAMYLLADANYNRKGMPQDYGQAAHWYQKAAELDHAGAMYMIGYMYYYGEGVEQNNDKALMWCRLAAQNGIEEAQAFIDEHFPE